MSGTTTRARLVSTVALLAAALALTGCQTPRDAPGGSPTEHASARPTDPVSPGPTELTSPGPTEPASPDPSDPSAPSTGPTDDAPITPGATELTITVDATGKGATHTFTLTCGPDGGDHPDAESACAALAHEGVDAFAPTPRDVACTQQWGGPEVATVEGTVDGEHVSARFDRRNGCEISRWDTLAPLFGPDAGLL